MSALFLKCTFKEISNAMVTLYSEMSTKSVIVEYLRKSACPNGIFYCSKTSADATGRAPGTGGFYKLENPSLYGLTGSYPNGLFVNVRSSAISTAVDASSTTATNNFTAARVATVTTTEALNPASMNLGNIGNNTDDLVDQLNVVRVMDSTRNIKDKDPVNGTLNRTNYDYAEYDGSDYNQLRLIHRLFNVTYGSETTEYQKNILRAFDRYKIPNPSAVLSKAFPRVFITRPSLNLFEGSTLLPEVTNDPLFYNIYKTDPELLRSLTAGYDDKHHFNAFLSNMASSFDLSNESIENVEVGETYTGWSIKYGRHNIKSRGAGNFSISYTDNQTLQVYKMHKAWVEYISKVYRGELKASNESIHNRILDYAVSVYYFLCAEDGETILYWCKYTGVFPTTVPAASFSWSKGDIVKTPEHSIDYEYAWKEDLNPFILRDFNYNSGIKFVTDGNIDGVRETIPVAATTYNNSILGTGYSFAGRPFVQTTAIGNDDNAQIVLKLKYAKLD